ncbi:MAG: 3-methyl-2-oxobutanoate hydroxymethyltransferase [Deltaproteobacteria bacterium RIFCSPLOWO2_12_FULL_44_12]|nr:MAG: 3-methyl-2-oxobutanoate hydroxymethyltransferase [Deltaproteobacteria bacterium RIFCSPHIGHO2_01_FULL_43_49]OGQ14563.1 MAG: 3-methyl-2-oxobutanoate hydroxymethyltransferase [Deltaproteobacteria bacterium RIFCSPHIGHO2_02_FULL_44_53]OGQ27949.1 MAG: 3-methyl-2-oxobutanoate hydroxymethyltransferase [Deltaproteobacteria bacterium RIFCSPHIGHO2_12_FULL_44_21]OGQ31161.1 MAG: 3-methyl-2-oxobutanoate hydroxymethyltransferase [Deltaproteobacteria bacterium RIFCSPLOWO2_01_FULL_45_74]OGQ43153.1 MAG: 
MKKTTIPQLLKKVSEGNKLTMLTAYDASFARIVDLSGIDMILVGDSLGMVMQGHENTIPVTLEDVLYHTQCVTRVVKRAHVTADMPFMSYQASKEEALKNAARLMKEAKAEAVKMEGGKELAETVFAMVQAGIPVMGHIGLRPQQILKLGGYKIQGKDFLSAEHLLAEAKVLEEAGCFAIVLEGVALETARQITQNLTIPTIGIASGPYCKGQVLVLQDLLGMNAEFRPRHTKIYADLSKIVSNAVHQYIQEVQAGQFPTEDHATHRNLQAVK